MSHATPASINGHVYIYIIMLGDGCTESKFMSYPYNWTVIFEFSVKRWLRWRRRRWGLNDEHQISFQWNISCGRLRKIFYWLLMTYPVAKEDTFTDYTLWELSSNHFDHRDVSIEKHAARYNKCSICCRRHFQVHFLEHKYLICSLIFTEIYS